MLTYLERKKIRDGEIKPPNMTLMELIDLVSSDFAVDFWDVVKTFPLTDSNGDSINSEAQEYKSNMTRVCNQRKAVNFQKNGGLLNDLLERFIDLIGRSTYNFQAIQGANQTQWENFVKSGNPNDNSTYDGGMKRIFEHVSGVSKESKQAYDAL